MRAIVFDNQLKYETNYPKPRMEKGWALIRVNKAGICGTDLEIIRGYKGFHGILGHEFVGTVEACLGNEQWIGRRVVGEINITCGNCAMCVGGMSRHCLNRQVLGISGLNGCMADYCVLPLANLIPVPDEITDEQAVFLEPLSAACAIEEQVAIDGSERILVLGDGRLGILCAWVLATVASRVTLVGHHPEKLAIARWRDLQTVCGDAGVDSGADMVVEATGSASGLRLALALCRPRGTIVLKSTLATPRHLDLNSVVINEQTLIGSRCGRFTDGIELLKNHPHIPLHRLISGIYPIEAGLDAFEQAARPEVLKILLELD